MKVILAIRTHKPSYGTPRESYTAVVMSTKIDPTTGRRPVLHLPGGLNHEFYRRSELESKARAHLVLFGFTDIAVKDRSSDDDD